jgi:hypothetical protein
MSILCSSQGRSRDLTQSLLETSNPTVEDNEYPSQNVDSMSNCAAYIRNNTSGLSQQEHLFANPIYQQQQEQHPGPMSTPTRTRTQHVECNHRDTPYPLPLTDDPPLVSEKTPCPVPVANEHSEEVVYSSVRSGVRVNIAHL